MLAKHRTALVWSCFGAVILALFFASTLFPSYRECKPAAAYADGYFEYSDFEPPPLPRPNTAWAFIECEGVFLERNAGALTALATIAIAAFTIALWRATTRQGQLTQQSIDLARAEFLATHRPRIKIRFISAPIEQADETLFRVTIANVGESPANITSDTFQVLEHTGWEGVEVALQQPAATADIWLVSGARHVFEYRTSHAWTVDRDNTIIVIGEIVYTDEAGEHSVTRRTGFARTYDDRRGGYSVSEIYAENEYED